MAIELINPGTAAGAGNGDSIRDGFIRANQNFSELAQRLATLERWGLSYGAYTTPGTAGLADFMPSAGPVAAPTSFARWQGASAGSLAAAQSVRMCPMSASRFLVTYVNGTTQTVIVVDFANGVVTSASATRTENTSAAPYAIVPVSPTFARILMRSGNNAAAATTRIVDVTYDGASVTLGTALTPTPSANFFSAPTNPVYMPSANTRGFLVGSTSALCFARVGTFSGNAPIPGGGVSAAVIQRGHGATPMADVPAIRSAVVGSNSACSHDWLGGERFIVFASGINPVTGLETPRVSVVTANDDGAQVLSSVGIPGSAPTNYVSCWALSPTLALVAWHDGSSYRTAAVGIDTAGKCTLLGPVSSAGQNGTAVVAGFPETATTFIQLVLVGNNLNAYRFSFNAVTGQWDAPSTVIFQIPAGWMSSGASPAVMDAIKVGPGRVAVLIHNTATAWPVGIDVLDFPLAA